MTRTTLIVFTNIYKLNYAQKYIYSCLKDLSILDCDYYFDYGFLRFSGNKTDNVVRIFTCVG